MTSPERFDIETSLGAIRPRAAAHTGVSPIRRSLLTVADQEAPEARALVSVETLIVRPLDLHTAVGTMTLRFRLAEGGRGSLFLLLAPMDTQSAQVQILRAHPHDDCCGEYACGVNIPVSASKGTAMQIDLRIEGPQVGIMPPALQARATLSRFFNGGLDECTTAHTLHPRFEPKADR